MWEGCCYTLKYTNNLAFPYESSFIAFIVFVFFIISLRIYNGCFISNKKNYFKGVRQAKNGSGVGSSTICLHLCSLATYKFHDVIHQQIKASPHADRGSMHCRTAFFIIGGGTSPDACNYQNKQDECRNRTDYLHPRLGYLIACMALFYKHGEATHSYLEGNSLSHSVSSKIDTRDICRILCYHNPRFDSLTILSSCESKRQDSGDEVYPSRPQGVSSACASYCRRGRGIYFQGLPASTP